MGNARPVQVKCWIAFLKSKNCQEAKGKKHAKWKCPGCLRSIIFRDQEKEIPFAHIKSNLQSMGVTVEEFWAWEALNCK